MSATAMPPMMPDDADLAAVSEMLESLLALQNELHRALSEKLAAMKRADTDSIQAWGAREAALLEQFGRLELQRHTLLGRLSVRWGRTGGADLRMRDVIAAAPPPLAARLESLASSLRDRMLAVADANRVVALATQAMSEHFRIVFEAFSQATSENAGYRRDGRCESAPVGVLDAVG